MQKNLRLLPLLAFAFITIFATACKNEQECTKCVVAKGTETTLKMSLFGNVLKEASVKYWFATKQEDYPDYFIGDIRNDEKLLNACIGYLEENNINIKNKQKILDVALYLTESVDGKTILNNNHVKGISVFTLLGDQCSHLFFIKKDGVFIELKKERFVFEGITHNHLAKILNKTAIKGKGKKSYLTISGNLSEEYAKKLMKIYEKRKISNINNKSDDGMGCLAPCGYRSGYCNKVLLTVAEQVSALKQV